MLGEGGPGGGGRRARGAVRRALDGGAAAGPGTLEARQRCRLPDILPPPPPASSGGGAALSIYVGV